MEGKLEKIYEASKMVIRDCALENGALVAANSLKPYYDHEAKHYFYVWPRDAAYTCMAAKAVGITDIQEPFFDWILDRAEDIDEDGRVCHHHTGLLYEKYYVNGLQAVHRYQPDQGGAVLFAIADFYKDNPDGVKKYEQLVKGLADGTSKRWTKNHFDIVTNDLWEERHTYPDLKDNFSYSMASCSAGLMAANQLFPNPTYVEAAEEMKKLLIDSAAGKGYFYRSFGILDDDRIDASAMGIVWPFDMINPNDEVSHNTINKIIEKLAVNNGIYRYEHDEYDGWMYRGFHRKKGAGYWPLLNFWLAIVLNKMGRSDEAEKYFWKAVEDVPETGLIAEQVFNNDIQKAVSPLCWSHNMFILACRELGIN